MLCCETRVLVTLVLTIILKDTETIQVLFIVSLFCAWNITTVEISSGFYLKVKFVKCLCLLPVVLVCYFGLGLGLVSSGLGLVTLVFEFGLIYITGKKKKKKKKNVQV